jgi:hypothetical protein
VTFNYDRIPELSFVRYFPEIANNGMDLYGASMLNTGFSDWKSALQFGDGFCYLKLHGSVGVIPIGRDDVEAASDHRFAHYAGLASKKFEITDTLYFEAGDTELPTRRIAPVIAFPIDKQHVESGEKNITSKTTLMRLARRPVKFSVTPNELR